jgi:hypothetical protein
MCSRYLLGWQRDGSSSANVSYIHQRIDLLKGIYPEAIELLQEKQFTPGVTRILRNMKAAH